MDISVIEQGGLKKTLDMLTRLGLVHFATVYRSLRTLLTQLRNATNTVPGVYWASLGQTNVTSESSSFGGPNPQLSPTNFASEFLKIILLTMESWVEKVEWTKPGAQVFLFHQYIPLSLFSNISSSSLCMAFRLGKALVVETLIDGGLVRSFREENTEMEPCGTLLISIEVLL